MYLSLVYCDVDMPLSSVFDVSLLSRFYKVSLLDSCFNVLGTRRVWEFFHETLPPFSRCVLGFDGLLV